MKTLKQLDKNLQKKQQLASKKQQIILQWEQIKVIDLMVRYANMVNEGGEGLSSNKQEATHYYKMDADSGIKKAAIMAVYNGNPTASLLYAFMLNYGEVYR